MSWNYRVVKKTTEGVTWYGIHEVYYDEKGRPDMCTQDTIGLQEESIEDLEFIINKTREALSHPVLDYEEF